MHTQMYIRIVIHNENSYVTHFLPSSFFLVHKFLNSWRPYSSGTLPLIHPVFASDPLQRPVRTRKSQAGLTFASSYRSLEAVRRKPDESMEEFLKNMAASIQKLMNEEMVMRTVKNE